LVAEPSGSEEVPSESDLITTIMEITFKKRRLEEKLNDLQNIAETAPEHELAELRNQGRLIRTSLNSYIEDLRIYRKMYQDNYSGR